MGGRHDLEWVTLEGLGEGHLVPKDQGQKHELLLYDRRHPERDDEGRPLFAVRTEDGIPVCGSPKTGGHYCAQTARYPNGRCHAHGGPSRRGIAHPNFDTGEYSKYQIPPTLIERYKAYLEDPEIAHHRQGIAQIDTLLNELWKNYQEGPDPELWRRLNEVYGRLVVAEKARNTSRARELFPLTRCIR